MGNSTPEERKKQQMLSNFLHNIVAIYVARFKGFDYMG